MAERDQIVPTTGRPRALCSMSGKSPCSPCPPAPEGMASLGREGTRPGGLGEGQVPQSPQLHVTLGRSLRERRGRCGGPGSCPPSPRQQVGLGP